MECFEERVDNAKYDIKNLEGDIWAKVLFLSQSGYSLRVIEEVLGVSRSKLQRFLSETNNSNIDDPRNQERNSRVKIATRLHKMGFDKHEIAKEMDINVRTVESYLRQTGIKASTKFG